MIPVFAFAGQGEHPVFKDAHVFEVRIFLDSPDFLADLYASHETREYIASRIEIDGQDQGQVGVRFKGTSSFYGYPTDKKSLRVKFNAFTDKDFHGLKKINLNNGWSDPTMLREKLFLDFLYEQGIHAPRANFARVYLNDRYWGLYTLVEQVDKVFLKDRFGLNDGNLFKAEKQADLSWQGDQADDYRPFYDLKTNEKQDDWTSLIKMIDFINHFSDQDFSSQLNQVLDVEAFIKAWASNILVINLDTYLGSANNFYLYFDENSNQCRWIIWDVNLAFGARLARDTLNIYYNPHQRVLIDRLLQNADYHALYLKTMKTLLHNFSAEILFPRIDDLFELIREDYLADTLKMYSNDEVLISLTEDLGDVPGLKKFIQVREEDVYQQLYPSQLEKMNDREQTERPSAKNFPNPFNEGTVFYYELSEPGQVSLYVFNALGQRAMVVNWDSQNKGLLQKRLNFPSLASGIYFYQLLVNGQIKTSGKMNLIR